MCKTKHSKQKYFNEKVNSYDTQTAEMSSLAVIITILILMSTKLPKCMQIHNTHFFVHHVSVTSVNLLITQSLSSKFGSDMPRTARRKCHLQHNH